MPVGREEAGLPSERIACHLLSAKQISPDCEWDGNGCAKICVKVSVDEKFVRI